MSSLRNVQLKFSRQAPCRCGKHSAPHWSVAAVLTYISPAQSKKRIELPELGPLTTAQKNTLGVRFCPAFFLIESPTGEYHFYNPQGEHTAAIPAAEAGRFDTFSVADPTPPLRFIGATFRKGNEMRLFSPQGELLSHYPAAEED